MSRKPLYLTAFVLFASTGLWGQGSRGGSRGGGERGGGLGAGPSSMGGGSARGNAAGRIATGAARESSVRSGTRARPAAGAAQATTARRAAASSQVSVAAGGIGAARARGGSSVVIVPGSNSIPSMGGSIPPLERSGSLAVADARRDSAIFDFNRGRGGFQRRGGAFYSLPVVVVPYAYGAYGNAYDNPNVIVVDRDSQTSAGHVVTVEPQKAAQARPPIEPKVIDVTPGTPESGAKGEGAQVEVLRGESRLDLKEQQTIYLVALRSGVIYTSREHWLEGDALHFITKQGTRQTVPLEAVDLDFTRQLNAERGLPFVLEVRPRSEQ
jgi:hypothetical protein